MNMPTTLMLLMSFMLTLLTLISRQQHILSTLLCLESLMIFMILYSMLSLNNQSMLMNPISIIMLSINASSASIGISLMIMVSRKQGNDCSSSQLTGLC